MQRHVLMKTAIFHIKTNKKENEIPNYPIVWDDD